MSILPRRLHGIDRFVVPALTLAMAIGALGAAQAQGASTEGAPSEVQTEPAEPTPGGFRLRGQLNPESSPTTYYFVYKDTRTECEEKLGCGPTTAVGGPLTGNTQQEVPPIEVTGLTPGQTYRYWLVAINGQGSVRGPELTFLAGMPAPNPSPTNVKLEAVISISPIGVAQPSPTSSQPIAPPVFGGLKADTNRLAKALKTCRKMSKHRRAACEKQARRKYGKAARK